MSLPWVAAAAGMTPTERMLEAVVVVPARDEELRLPGCLRALAAQTVGHARFRTVLVLDGCRDGSRAVALATAGALDLPLRVMESPRPGPGWARRTGMDMAAEMLTAAGRPRGLIASTDADSAVAPDWLERQLAHRAAGAEAIAGRIELAEEEAALLPAGVRARRSAAARRRLREVRRHDPAAAHHHFGGASFSVTADLYARVGGIEPLNDLEDEGFARRLRAHGVVPLRADDVQVRTSARLRGRARRGLAADLAALSQQVADAAVDPLVHPSA